MRDDQQPFTAWCGGEDIRYAHGTYNYGRVPDQELMQQMGHSTRNMMDRYARTARLNQSKMYNLYLPGQNGKEIVAAEVSANEAQTA